LASAGAGSQGRGHPDLPRSANLAGSVTRWLWGASSALVAEDTAAQSLEADPLGLPICVGAMVATVG
jgi:hypothetical protein